MQNGHMLKKSMITSQTAETLWQAIQTITDYKPPLQACDDDTSLPDALNHFYSRFEMQNDTPTQKLAHTSQRPGALSVSSRRKEDPILD